MHKFIAKVETHQTGGGCYVDFITLSNGQVIAIDNDLIGLYDNYDDFGDGRDGDFSHVRLIAWNNLPNRSELQNKLVRHLLETMSHDDLVDYYLATRDEDLDKMSDIELFRIARKIAPSILCE
jgi:hypothetical protein